MENVAGHNILSEVGANKLNDLLNAIRRGGIAYLEAGIDSRSIEFLIGVATLSKPSKGMNLEGDDLAYVRSCYFGALVGYELLKDCIWDNDIEERVLEIRPTVQAVEDDPNETLRLVREEILVNGLIGYERAKAFQPMLEEWRHGQTEMTDTEWYYFISGFGYVVTSVQNTLDTVYFDTSLEYFGNDTELKLPFQPPSEKYIDDTTKVLGETGDPNFAQCALAYCFGISAVSSGFVEMLKINGPSFSISIELSDS
jgi:hypothetical protein